MAAGYSAVDNAFDPIRKKLKPIRGRIGGRFERTLTDPNEIARAKRNPFLTGTERQIERPTETRYADQILRQYDPTGTGNPMGAKAPIVAAETIDAFDTELDRLFVTDVVGSAIPKKKAMTGTPGSFGSDKKHEVVFSMPGGSGYGDPTGRRKKRRPSLMERGSTRGGY